MSVYDDDDLLSGGAGLLLVLWKKEKMVFEGKRLVLQLFVIIAQNLRTLSYLK